MSAALGERPTSLVAWEDAMPMTLQAADAPPGVLDSLPDLLRAMLNGSDPAGARAICVTSSANVTVDSVAGNVTGLDLTVGARALPQFCPSPPCTSTQHRLVSVEDGASVTLRTTAAHGIASLLATSAASNNSSPSRLVDVAGQRTIVRVENDASSPGQAVLVSIVDPIDFTADDVIVDLKRSASIFRTIA